MSCNFTEKISSLIDGELTQTEVREVERHLLQCAECEQLRADFLNLRSQIASFETSVQPAVQNRALKKILATQRHVPARGLQWGFGTQAVAFATLLIVGAIIGLIVYQSSKRTSANRTGRGPNSVSSTGCFCRTQGDTGRVAETRARKPTAGAEQRRKRDKQPAQQTSSSQAGGP